MFPACRPAGALQTIDALCDFVQRATGHSLIGLVTDLLSLTLIGSAMTISPVIRPASRAPEIAVSPRPVLVHPFSLLIGNLPGVIGRLDSSEALSRADGHHASVGRSEKIWMITMKSRSAALKSRYLQCRLYCHPQKEERIRS